MNLYFDYLSGMVREWFGNDSGMVREWFDYDEEMEGR